MSETKQFTQEEIDRIVSERLKREKQKTEKELEAVREEATRDMPDYKSEYLANKAEYLSKLRQVKLLEAGLPYEDIEKYSKYIKSEDEKEIATEAADLAAELSGSSTKSYADPSQKTKVWNPFS